MKKIILVWIILFSTESFASNVEGLYWYAENKVIVEGQRKDGMIIKKSTLELVNGDLKTVLTCKIDENTGSLLIFTCKTSKVTKTLTFNVTENGNYLFMDNDPDNGGYIKQ